MHAQHAMLMSPGNRLPP